MTGQTSPCFPGSDHVFLRKLEPVTIGLLCKYRCWFHVKSSVPMHVWACFRVVLFAKESDAAYAATDRIESFTSVEIRKSHKGFYFLFVYLYLFVYVSYLHVLYTIYSLQLKTHFEHVTILICTQITGFSSISWSKIKDYFLNCFWNVYPIHFQKYSSERSGY